MSSNYLLSGRLSGRLSGSLSTSGPLGSGVLASAASGAAYTTSGSGSNNSNNSNNNNNPLHSTSGRFSGRFANNNSGRLSRPHSGRFPSGNIAILDGWLKDLEDVAPGNTAVNNANLMAVDFPPRGKRIRNSSVRTLLDSSMEFTGQTIFTDKPAAKKPAHINVDLSPNAPPVPPGIGNTTHNDLLSIPHRQHQLHHNQNHNQHHNNPQQYPRHNQHHQYHNNHDNPTHFSNNTGIPANMNSAPPLLRDEFKAIDQPVLNPMSPLGQLASQGSLGRPSSAKSISSDVLLNALNESYITTPTPVDQDTHPGFIAPGGVVAPTAPQPAVSAAQPYPVGNNASSPTVPRGAVGRSEGTLRGPRIIRNATPSHFCHICSRCDDVVKTLTCKNIAEGRCRKVICEKCFEKYGYDWEAAKRNIEDWQCTHCAGTCPERARCSIYTKTNSFRQLTNNFKRGVNKLSGGVGSSIAGPASANGSGMLNSPAAGALRNPSPRSGPGQASPRPNPAQAVAFNDPPTKQAPLQSPATRDSGIFPPHPVVTSEPFLTGQSIRKNRGGLSLRGGQPAQSPSTASTPQSGISFL